jgi:membrane protease YdiL (CAAX protease family)
MIRPLLSISPLVLFGLIGPGFALLNACAEEFFFRGIIQESLNSIMKNQCAVITIQAIFFAAAHFNAGFPNGIIGFFMVFGWGAVIGYMRQRTAGLLAPVITHVAADIIIFTTLGVLASTVRNKSQITS